MCVSVSSCECVGERERRKKKKGMLIVPGTLTDVTESVFIEKLPSEVPLVPSESGERGGGA